jgi:hypothetical protein
MPNRLPLLSTEVTDDFIERDATALVCSGACGADLLALDVAGALGLRRRLVLPFEPDRFHQNSRDVKIENLPSHQDTARLAVFGVEQRHCGATYGRSGLKTPLLHELAGTLSSGDIQGKLLGGEAVHCVNAPGHEQRHGPPRQWQEQTSQV